MSNDTLTAADLRKAASALNTLSEQTVMYEKRAEATGLLFEQVEKGLIAPPRSKQEFETKLAALMTQDLRVIAEAIKLATGSAGSTGFGTLEETSTPSHSESSLSDSEATRNFQHALMEA